LDIFHTFWKISNIRILIEFIEFWIYSTDFGKKSNIRILIEFIEYWIYSTDLGKILKNQKFD
jgi:hypothetical protein